MLNKNSLFKFKMNIVKLIMFTYPIVHIHFIWLQVMSGKKKKKKSGPRLSTVWLGPEALHSRSVCTFLN